MSTQDTQRRLTGPNGGDRRRIAFEPCDNHIWQQWHLVAVVVVVLVGAGAFLIGRASASKSHSGGVPVVAVATTTTGASVVTVIPPATVAPTTALPVTAAPTTTAPPVTAPPAAAPPLPTVTFMRDDATWTWIEPSDAGGFSADGN